MDIYRSRTQGTPLILLHGLTGAWSIWRPLLPALEAAHRVIAPTLPGHHGAANLPADRPPSIETLADLLEVQLDAEQLPRAHFVGNSLGGWLALEMARRGRALSVVALSPGGGWASQRDLKRVVRLIRNNTHALRLLAPIAKAIVKSPAGRRVLLRSVMERGEQLPYEEAIALFDAVIGCSAVFDILSHILQASPPVDPRADRRFDCPVRIAWSEFDRTLPFENYGKSLVQSLPESELVMLRGVGHVPMYDDPDLVIHTILEVTQSTDEKLAKDSA